MTSAYFGSPRGLVSYCNTYPCFDTVEVWGSSPHGPTIQNKDLARIPKKHSGVQKHTLLRPSVSSSLRLLSCRNISDTTAACAACLAGHDQSQTSARFDGNLTVVTYIRHQWLRNFPRLSIAAYPVNLGKLPTKPSAVCVLGRRALRGSDRFSSTVSIRQRHSPDFFKPTQTRAVCKRGKNSRMAQRC